MAAVKVYGADWCPLTTHTRRFLDQKQVAYDYVDIDHDQEAAAWVASHNDGKEKKPTLDVAGEVVTTPTDTQLDQLLKSKGLLN
jgi:glutaredoxin